MKVLLKISLLFVLVIQTNYLIAQNRPIIELSTALSPHLVLAEAIEIAPSFPTSINYVFNPRLSAGILLTFENMPTYHSFYNYSRESIGSEYLGASDDELEDDWYVAQGIGINVKYNFIMNPYFNLYAQIQANYLSLSISDEVDGERQYDIENESGEVIHTFTADPLPFENQNAMTFNLTLGADIKVNRWLVFYFQYDFRDINKSLNIYYNIEMSSTRIEEPGGSVYYKIDDVKYSESIEKQSFSTLHLGMRFYLFDRKY